jgi:hypothetical protein
VCLAVLAGAEHPVVNPPHLPVGSQDTVCELVCPGFRHARTDCAEHAVPVCRVDSPLERRPTALEGVLLWSPPDVLVARTDELDLPAGPVGRVVHPDDVLEILTELLQQ